MKNFSVFLSLAIFIVCISCVESTKSHILPHSQLINGKSPIKEWFSGTPVKNNDKNGNKKKPSKTDVRPSIIGGVPVSSITLRNYHAAVQLDCCWFCNGAVIAPSWILTTAACARDTTDFTVGVGSVDTTVLGYFVHSTRNKLVHRGFSARSMTNDIALIKLEEPLTFSVNVGAIRLPSATQYRQWNIVNLTVQTSGFGAVTQGGLPSTTLNILDLVIVNREECKVNVTFVGPKVFCTGPDPTKNLCDFDAGGPATVIDPFDNLETLAGLMSFTDSDNCLDSYTVFTNVADYIYWIQRATNGEVAVRP